jgi:hypothetical protein
MGTARYFLGSAGIQTAALASGGNNATAGVAVTEEYDGASWTAGGTMGTARGGSGGAGTQTAALIFGGNPPPAGFNNTEEYDGNLGQQVEL